MPIITPFVRYICRNKEDRVWNYKVIIGSGHHVTAAVEIQQPEGLTIYRPDEDFYHKYCRTLRLGPMMVWTNKQDLKAWFDIIYFNSFYNFSRANTDGCWFVKTIYSDDLKDSTAIPDGFPSFVHHFSRTFWFLIQNGSKLWPVRVDDNKFSRGWPEFYRDHGLGTNYTVVFACERKWIFNVSIFNEVGEHVPYTWSTNNHNFEHIYGPNDQLRTSCSPLFLFAQEIMITFGYYFVPEDNIKQEFQRKLRNVLQNPATNQIIFKMGVTQWIVPVINNNFHSESFALFSSTLNLEPYDFVYVSLTSEMIAWIIVFNDDGIERINLGTYPPDR